MITETRSTKRHRSVLIGVFLAVGMAAFIIVSAGAIPVPEKTQLSTSRQARILSVDAVAVTPFARYTVQRNFVGRVEAARVSRLGFELNGMLKKVLVDEGDFVQKGQRVAELDSRRLEARRAELTALHAQAKATLELRKRTFSRVRSLHDNQELKAASTQRRDEAELGYAVQKAVVKRIKSQIEIIDVDLHKSILFAPYNGKVSRRHIDEGTVVAAGEPILELQESERNEIRVGIDNRTAAGIETGRELEVQIEGRTLRAAVRSILPDLSQATRTVPVILTLEEGAETARHGNLATVSIPYAIETAGFWLPRSALTESARGLWACYVAEPATGKSNTGSDNYRLQRRELELLHQEEDRVYVRGTLSAGEKVVSGGLHRLAPGQLVDMRKVG